MDQTRILIKSKKSIALLFALVMVFMAWTDLFALDKSDKEIIVEGNNIFTFDIYAQLKKSDGNLFFSPYSISTALAMTYAGARGNTATQMANVLHFNLGQERLHPAFSELMRSLTAGSKEGNYQINIANALWGQSGYNFYKQFVNITKNYYNAKFKEVDFKNKTEKTRKIINRWVEKKTNYKIKNLIKRGVLTPLIRLILTNAVYFKGNWLLPFHPSLTRLSSFTLIEGEKVEVPMMNRPAKFNYSEKEMLQILEMPYASEDLSMIILLPKQTDGLKEIENLLTLEKVKSWLSALKKQEVVVFIPKFKITSEFILSKMLKSLGMTDAFSMELADFSGIAPDAMGLYISEVIHKAFVDVNEEGTEAAAATAVVVKELSFPKERAVFRADHPFIFIIRDMRSGSILFLGRIMDPR